jgi:gamma-glutamylaminecyclotransferase
MRIIAPGARNVATILFVYGTLKRGQLRHDLLAGAEFLGEARTLPRYRLFDLRAYPGLASVIGSGTAVEGELWRVDEATFRRLDEYEGALFRRERVKLASVSEPVDCYFYTGNLGDARDCGASWPPT